MRKQVYLDSVEYAILVELAKKSPLRPEQYLKKLIIEAYDKNKK